MCGCNKAKRVAPAPALRPAAARVDPLMLQDATPAPEPVYPSIGLATVDTSVWGAPLWCVLHTASVLMGGRRQISLWRNLLAALTNSLPCPECSAHYNAWYKRTPLRFSLLGSGVQGTVLNWVLGLHNDVNRRLGRPPWSADQVRAAYRDLGAARTALTSLRSIIGDGAYDSATALLAAL